MTTQQDPAGETRPAVSPTPPEQRQRNWLPLARKAWIVLALLLLVYFVASIPITYQAFLTVCTLPDPAQCTSGQTTLGNTQALAQFHVSLAAYVSLEVALDIAVGLLFGLVSLLIFLRASRDWNGVFFPFLLLVVGATQPAWVTSGTTLNGQAPLILRLLVAVSDVLTVPQGAAIAALVLTFPTGRLNPRWSWVLILLEVVASVLPPSQNPAINTVVTLAWLLPYIGGLGVQLYRYARVYDAVQRQQTKWFVFTAGVGISLLVITSVPGVLVPSLGAPDSWYQLLPNPINTATLMALPLAVGIAILRYRLWDIDVLINRALVYSSLTALLAGLYVGLVLGLQAAVRATTGSLSDQPLVLVASTLAIAALFQPLRRRLQATIDGRFYRRKYDAARVVAAFSSTLRQEVDLDELRDQLVTVVQETMQPNQVSLWLRPTSQIGETKIHRPLV